MYYKQCKYRTVKTIEMLEISDVSEIVMRDLERYCVPDDEFIKIFMDYIKPLWKATDKLKKKYSPYEKG